MNTDTRFWNKVNKTDECWNWTGGTVQSNYYRYGIFKDGKKAVRAHRFSFAMYNGSVPEGLFVCHACDNPLCVNPAHLFLGTAQDNATDMVNKGRQAKGTTVHNAVLTDGKVKQIRQMYAERTASGKRKYTQQQIADKYGCTRRNISDIVNNKTWGHV